MTPVRKSNPPRTNTYQCIFHKSNAGLKHNKKQLSGNGCITNQQVSKFPVLRFCQISTHQLTSCMCFCPVGCLLNTSGRIESCTVMLTLDCRKRKQPSSDSELIHPVGQSPGGFIVVVVGSSLVVVVVVAALKVGDVPSAVDISSHSGAKVVPYNPGSSKHSAPATFPVLQAP